MVEATMLLQIRERYESAKYIDMANANVNAPMLYINEKLGFKFYKQNRTYSIRVDDVLNG